MPIDRLDQQILSELDNDARQGASKIARHLRTSKNVVNYRIKRLEQCGIITGYYSVIDTFRLGYPAYRIYIKLQNADPKKESEIMDYLVGLPQTWWVGSIKGKYDVGALFWARSQNEFVKVWGEFLKTFRQFIEHQHISIYVGLEHYRMPFAKKHLKERAKIESIGIGETAETDEMDMKLLQFISSNGRAPLIEIAKSLSLTPAAVQYRMRQLGKKKILLGFRPMINTEKLGYTLYKIDINLNDMSAYEKIARFARANENIFYHDKTIGWADMEIEAYSESPPEFYALLDEIRTKFSGSIRDFDFFTYSKITKTLYMPSA